VISTTFKDGSKFTLLDWFFVATKSLLLGYAAFLILSCVACSDAPTPRTLGPGPSVKTRIATAPVVQEEQPKQEQAAPEPKAEEPPYYGSTYWNELLTSVYYYPTKGGDNNDLAVPSTHLKFGHRDDSIWLCGDQRKTFKPGYLYRLTVTFEPNQPCATNWEIK